MEVNENILLSKRRGPEDCRGPRSQKSQGVSEPDRLCRKKRREVRAPELRTAQIRGPGVNESF